MHTLTYPTHTMPIDTDVNKQGGTLRGPARRIQRKLLILWRALTGYSESTTALGQAANRYWNNFENPQRATDSHWRGHGPFADDALWLKLGRTHHELLQQQLSSQSRPFAPCRVVEWGCGGGMNAVHFGRGAQRYYGVDLSPQSLAECARQMAAEGLPGFVPVLVDANEPRSALAVINEPCDLFICTYVFELLPGVEHALQILQLAFDLMAPQGQALVHIRCPTASLGGRSRPWDYEGNMTHNVTFSIPVFRAACEAQGFVVLGVQPVAAVPELNEKNYAFFVLEKPATAAAKGATQKVA